MEQEKLLLARAAEVRARLAGEAAEKQKAADAEVTLP